MNLFPAVLLYSFAPVCKIKFDTIFGKRQLPEYACAKRFRKETRSSKGRNMTEKGDRDKLDMSENLFTEQNM